jgi:hypothetical protein
VAARDPEHKVVIYTVEGTGSPVVVTGAQPGEEPYQWTADGKSLLVGHNEIPSRVFTVNVATNERKFLRAYSPADATGLFGSNAPTFSTDLKSYVYSYQRMTSDLYIVEGLK